MSTMENIRLIARTPFPFLSIETVLFRFKSWWAFFYLYSNIEKTFSYQTVETLIRRSVLLCLIWIGTVRTCLTERTLGLYGLTHRRSGHAKDLLYSLGKSQTRLRLCCMPTS